MATARYGEIRLAVTPPRKSLEPQHAAEARAIAALEEKNRLVF
jgi:hypothetical protein